MKKLLILTAIIGTFVIGFYFYFHHVGRLRPHVNETFIVSAHIPAPFDGARIVQISDLFIRSEACLTLLEHVVETVNHLNPDLIVFTGNLFSPLGLVYENSVTYLLEQLQANFAKIAILGDHDLTHQTLTTQVLTSVGFRLLNNESVQVFNQSPLGLNLIGAHPTNDRQDMEKLLHMHIHDMRFNLLLTSLPTFSNMAFDYNLHVQLSGHCLGLADTRSPSAPCFQFYDGTYQFADRFTLHVSHGLARFHTFSHLFRQPSIDSFLLIRE
ncbi:MAG: metallophosphoesterase [Defluviitaleaceae bacterium]|nr:metallophosphoesterase [Defluviitaleaceae bacterium]